MYNVVVILSVTSSSWRRPQSEDRRLSKPGHACSTFKLLSSSFSFTKGADNTGSKRFGKERCVTLDSLANQRVNGATSSGSILCCKKVMTRKDAHGHCEGEDGDDEENREGVNLGRDIVWSVVSDFRRLYVIGSGVTNEIETTY